jgi:DNA gyrase subunit A
MVHPEDEVFAITSAGGVIRTAAAEIKISGRQTMGVRLVNLSEGQSLVAIARNAEATAAEAAIDIDAEAGDAAGTPADAANADPASGDGADTDPAAGAIAEADAEDGNGSDDEGDE